MDFLSSSGTRLMWRSVTLTLLVLAACQVEAGSADDFETPGFVVGDDGSVSLDAAVVRLAQEQGCATDQVPKWVDSVGWACAEDLGSGNWSVQPSTTNLYYANGYVGVGKDNARALLDVDNTIVPAPTTDRANAVTIVVRNNSEKLRFGDTGNLGLLGGQPIFAANAVGNGQFPQLRNVVGANIPMAVLSLMRTPTSSATGGLFVRSGFADPDTAVDLADFTPALAWSVDGKVAVGHTTPRSTLHVAAAQAVLAIDSTDDVLPALPTGVAGVYELSGELWAFDSAGNRTQISPHNAAGEWVYVSQNQRTGKSLHINMERMIRRLEQLTGERFVTEDDPAPVAPPLAARDALLVTLRNENDALRERVARLERLVENLMTSR